MPNPFTTSEDYINELKGLRDQAKLKLDEAKASAAGAQAEYNNELANYTTIKTYADNIQATDQASRPVIASLETANSLVAKVADVTEDTLDAADVLFVATRELAILTETLEQNIGSQLDALIRQEFQNVPSRVPSPGVTNGMTTLKTATQAAMDAVLKAYADCLSFYKEMVVFKALLNMPNTKSEDLEPGDLKDDIAHLLKYIGETFPLSLLDEDGNPIREDDYLQMVVGQRNQAEGRVKDSRKKFQDAEKIKDEMQSEFDAIVASLTAAQTANGG
ncbi:MAG: hypothetical protein H6559_25335 [Lewinellaceae bacterium]|nr:hypothetical protein [Lewinellaceae bacterium]